MNQLYNHYFTFAFNGAITSANGTYAFIYQKLGTKGLLLKNGEFIREINRTYYCADVYEFPWAFVEIDDRTYLIHCPIAYDQLDFEDVETGELVTNIPGRVPPDIFHSRLEVSSDGSLLMDKGWVWHPLDRTFVFDIKDCFHNPMLLDKFDVEPPVDVEIVTASFIDNKRVLIGSSNEVIDEDNLSMFANQIATWDLQTNTISNQVAIDVEFGNLFVINERFAWDLYNFPKIIDTNSGRVIDSNKNINSGKQRSAIVSKSAGLPQIIFNYQTKQIAISGDEKIEILTPEMNL